MPYFDLRNNVVNESWASCRDGNKVEVRRDFCLNFKASSTHPGRSTFLGLEVHNEQAVLILYNSHLLLLYDPRSHSASHPNRTFPPKTAFNPSLLHNGSQ
jgi:hypothetical protein